MEAPVASHTIPILRTSPTVPVEPFTAFTVLTPAVSRKLWRIEKKLSSISNEDTIKRGTLFTFLHGMKDESRWDGWF